MTTRRPTKEQGQALVILGHAIEYLIDSYVVFASPDGCKSDVDAIATLMRMNREVFAECAVVDPWRERMRVTWSLLFRRGGEALDD
jgi:hypothetical protein